MPTVIQLPFQYDVYHFLRRWTHILLGHGTCNFIAYSRYSAQNKHFQNEIYDRALLAHHRGRPFSWLKGGSITQLITCDDLFR